VSDFYARTVSLVIRPLSALAGVSLICGCAELLTPASLTWRNDSLQLSWQRDQSSVRLENLGTGKVLAVPVGIRQVVLDVGQLCGDSDNRPTARVIRQRSEQIWHFTFAPLNIVGGDIKIRKAVEFEMAQGRPWVRKRASLRLTGPSGPILVREVVTDAFDMTGLSPRQPHEGWQSYPVLADSFFAGVEFPVASAKVEGERITLSYKPCVRVNPPAQYDAWPVIYGVAEKSDVRQAFEDYAATLRPISPPMHIQYNSWWSAPYPFTEQHMLDLARAFVTPFHEPYGGRLDSFCLDMGWSDPLSIWQLNDKHFPRGLEPLNQALSRIGARVALWISPSSHYPYPGAQDTEWARRQGYETLKPGKRRYACLAGAKYQRAFKESLVELTRRYHIAHFKFDGYTEICPQTDHGHEPGDESAEAIALGLIDVVRALRVVNPDIWLEATCFGFRPSPWWLAHFNTVIGTYGTDAPRGRVPCPVYRESCTTARDFFNLIGTKNVLIPVYAQEVLGIIHQTPDPLYNDAVTTVLRGHCFIPLYVNPKYMTDRQWRFLARLTNWARANADRLQHTKPLYFGRWADKDFGHGVDDVKLRTWSQAFPKDVYGYAHFIDNAGLLMLRNPWVRPRRVEIKLDESAGCEPSLKNATATCLYPRYGGLVGRYSYGDTLAVELGPYETKLLDLSQAPDIPPAKEPMCEITLSDLDSHNDEVDSRLDLSFTFKGCASPTQLWLLAEGKNGFAIPACRVIAGDTELKLQICESSKGWGADYRHPNEWVWFVADLPDGPTQVVAELTARDAVQASAWLVARESVPDDPDNSTPLPPPEQRWLNAVAVMDPVLVNSPQSASRPSTVTGP